MFKMGFQNCTQCCSKPKEWFVYAALLHSPQQATSLSTETLLLKRERIKLLSDQTGARNVWFLWKGSMSRSVCLCAYFCVLRVELQNVLLLHSMMSAAIMEGKIHARVSHIRLRFSSVPIYSLVNFCTQPWPFKPDKQSLPDCCAEIRLWGSTMVCK